MLTMRPAVVVVLILAATAFGHAQSNREPNEKGAASDDLLTEVRALRADLQQVAHISIRTQLLVARLQLQEQRINAIAGQLADARRLLSANETEQVPLARELQRAEDGIRDGSIPAEQVKDAEYIVGSLKAKLAQARRDHQQLENQATDLSNQLASEQSRWLDFNSRLDELEHLLPAAQR